MHLPSFKHHALKSHGLHLKHFGSYLHYCGCILVSNKFTYNYVCLLEIVISELLKFNFTVIMLQK